MSTKAPVTKPIDDEDDPVDETPEVGGNDAIAAVVDALNRNTVVQQRIAESAPPKKVLYSQFKTKSPFNPEGRSRFDPTRILTRRCFQNGTRLNERTLHTEEIRLLNELQPGKYINNRVAVEVRASNSADPDSLYIHYSDHEPADRLQNAQDWGSLVSLLRKCTQESKLRSR